MGAGAVIAIEFDALNMPVAVVDGDVPHGCSAGDVDGFGEVSRDEYAHYFFARGGSTAYGALAAPGKGPFCGRAECVELDVEAGISGDEALADGMQTITTDHKEVFAGPTLLDGGYHVELGGAVRAVAVAKPYRDNQEHEGEDSEPKGFGIVSTRIAGKGGDAAESRRQEKGAPYQGGTPIAPDDGKSAFGELRGRRRRRDAALALEVE